MNQTLTLRQLGRAGPSVSPIGVGAMSFSDVYGPTTEDNSRAILDLALETGVTLIDTADIYGMGRSELAIGAFLRDRPGVRDDLVICTKGGIIPGPPRRFDNAPDYLETALDASLTRLGIDCVDLYYVHRRDFARPIEEVTDTLTRLVAKGKTRAIGFSEIAPAELHRAMAIAPVAAVQSEYSLASRAPDLGMVQATADLGAALVAFSPLGRSLLTDHPIPQAVAATLQFLGQNPRFQADAYHANRTITDRFRRLAAEMGLPAASLAIAWVLQRGAHVLPIPGTRSVAHFRELLRGCEVRLGADDLARIDAVLPVGWAHGDRYSEAQWGGIARYC